MSINTITKCLNVYSHQEKIGSFLDMYANPVDIDQTVLINQLESYRHYLHWSQDHFNIGSYFDYDRSIRDIEKYILSLPIFKNHGQPITWQQKFGISLDDWNRCHFIPSDIGRLSSDHIKQLQMHQIYNRKNPLAIYQQLAPANWPAVNAPDDLNNLPDDIRQKFQVILQQSSCIDKLPSTLLTSQQLDFLEHNKTGYNNVQQAMRRMMELDILVSPPPIKKQTLQDKIHMIQNYQQCLETYNRWAETHSDIADATSDEQINSQIQEEHGFWRNLEFSSSVRSDPPTILKLECQNDDNHGPNQVS